MLSVSLQPTAPGLRRRTFTGPAGKPLAVGRPWGEACQPVRVAVTGDVPTGAFQQIAAVVIAARAARVDGGKPTGFRALRCRPGCSAAVTAALAA